MPTEFSTIIPGSVLVSFRRIDDGYPSASVYTKEVAFPGGSAFPNGLTGHSGTKYFRDSAAITYTGGSPDNQTEIDDLATQIATDWYAWQVGRQFTRFACIVPYILDGLVDSVTWSERSDEVSTFVHRSPWLDGVETLNHWSTNGESVEEYPVDRVDDDSFIRSLCFGTTGVLATAPSHRVKLPTVTITGTPTYAGNAGEVAVNTIDDEVFFYNGTSWFTVGGGSGITSLNGETGTTQTFSDTDDTNVKLAITSSANDHEFAVTWLGTLAHERGGLEADVSGYGGYVLISGGTTTEVKLNLSASTAPTATDDTNAGYVVGSRWIDTTNDKEYVCLDTTATAAVWTETTQAGGGSVTTTDGDIIIHDGSATRLPIAGDEDRFLGIRSGLPSWELTSNLMTVPIQCRISLDTSLAYPTASLADQTTLYLHPWEGNKIRYFGRYYTFTKRSLSLSSLSASTLYYIYAKYNDGTGVVDLTASATGPVYHTNGYRVLPTDDNELLVGAIWMDASTKCQYTDTKLFIVNEYNLRPRRLWVDDISTGHQYASNTVRKWNNTDDIRLDFIRPMQAAQPLVVTVNGGVQAETNGDAPRLGLGVDSGSVSQLIGSGLTTGNDELSTLSTTLIIDTSNLNSEPHYLQMLEYGDGSGSGATFDGASLDALFWA